MKKSQVISLLLLNHNTLFSALRHSNCSS